MARHNMLQSILTSRGQTTVPKAVRDALRLRSGDQLRYTIQGGVASIRPLRRIERLRGIVLREGPALSLEDMDRAVATGVLES